jgi:hypothetical protein
MWHLFVTTVNLPLPLSTYTNLSPWSRVLEKLIVIQVIRNSLPFTELEVSLPCSKEPTSRPYP